MDRNKHFKIVNFQQLGAKLAGWKTKLGCRLGFWYGVCPKCAQRWLKQRFNLFGHHAGRAAGEFRDIPEAISGIPRLKIHAPDPI